MSTTETIPPPEVFRATKATVSCEGIGGALGHPRVWLQIGSSGYADCGYCDRRFILEGGPADRPTDSAANQSSAANPGVATAPPPTI